MITELTSRTDSTTAMREDQMHDKWTKDEKHWQQEEAREEWWQILGSPFLPNYT